MPVTPEVSVVMAVRDGARYLREAIDSILQQTFTNFEFIIIDDGSRDATPAILERAAAADNRVRVVRQNSASGLTASLRRGFAAAEGEFIARMDADDISEKGRLRQQTEFLQAHGDYGIVGSSITYIDENGKDISFCEYPETDIEIRWVHLFAPPFAHPAVMLRRAVLQEHALTYNEKFSTTQDYELWSRLLPVTRGYNLPDPLLRYRLHPASINRTKGSEQRAHHDDISLFLMRQEFPGRPISPAENQFLRRIQATNLIAEGRSPREENGALTLRYLEMLREFSQRPQTASFSTRFRRREIWKLLRYLLTGPPPPQWMKILLQAVRFDPLFFLYLPRSLRYKVRRWPVPSQR